MVSGKAGSWNGKWAAASQTQKSPTSLNALKIAQSRRGFLFIHSPENKKPADISQRAFSL
jgi:hypothetical protein